MNLDFLSPGAPSTADREAPVARSPMERSASEDGGRFELRDGWNVAVDYGAGAEREADAARHTAVWADVSPLGKLELQGPADELSAIVAECADGAELERGTATRAGGAWWCPLTPTRALVVCDPAALAALRTRVGQAAAAAQRVGVLDVTTTFAALTIAGPRAREVLARLSAIDLRPQKTPVGGLRPGSVARQPAIVICESADRYLLMFGWATGEYVWSVISDAGHHLGGCPIGLDALAALPGPAGAREASRA